MDDALPENPPPFPVTVREQYEHLRRWACDLKLEVTFPVVTARQYPTGEIHADIPADVLPICLNWEPKISSPGPVEVLRVRDSRQVGAPLVIDWNMLVTREEGK